MNLSAVCTLIAITVGLGEAQLAAWNGLTISWSLDPNNQNAWEALPYNMNEGFNSGFVPSLDDNTCVPTATRPFVGYVYEDPTAVDPHAVRLLVDKSRYVVGMQTAVAAADYTPASGLPVWQQMTIGTTPYYTLTTYFVYPSAQALNEDPNSNKTAFPTRNVTLGVDICNYGRRTEDVKTFGSGTGLWALIGPVTTAPISFSSQTVEAFPTHEQAIDPAAYTKGQCVVTQGVNYFKVQSKPVDCAATQPYPIVPLFNDGQLNAFAFQTRIPAAKRTHIRWEHFGISQLTDMYASVPYCFYASTPSWTGGDGWSWLHVYFTKTPQRSSNC